MSTTTTGSPNYKEIPVMKGLSSPDFFKIFSTLEQPVILQDYEDVTDWEVVRQCTMESFSTEFGDLEIYPRVNYPDPDHWWINPFETKPSDFPPFQKMSFREFISRACNPATERSPVYWRNRGEHNESIVNENMQTFIDGIHFERIIPRDSEFHLDILIGSAGTRAGFHQDDRHNFLLQITGKKRVYLGSPYQTRYFYPFPGIPEKSPIAPDHSNPRYPRFSESTILTGEIGPGEILFIPRGWWHSLLGLEPTIMLACFYGERLNNQDMEHMYLSLGIKHRISAHFEFLKRFTKSSLNILSGKSPTEGLTVWWTPGTAAAISFFNKMSLISTAIRRKITGKDVAIEKPFADPFF